jgi:predicted site-specific integrase-resolvase
MGFLAYRKGFKDISHSLFTFKNKAHTYAHVSCRTNSLDFTQAVATPTEHALKKYKELTKSFGFIINTELKQIDELKKQEALGIYQEINDIIDTLPESIRQTMKAK